MADTSREDFDPEWNCPTHFASGDPTCPACIAKQPRPRFKEAPMASVGGKKWVSMQEAVTPLITAIDAARGGA